ncbi:hypothetical protein BaRGS_00001767 [Batillaria attramentaria]|uniref:Dr1-associated corepressor n=1 Tax=Batillaria attramentaria TaxID=370345 RepID=A0ABD0M662_9CAEN
MPSKKKKYNARFPPARIKKIMQMDEEVGKVAATVPVIISRALELFIESLIMQASQTTLERNAKTLSTSHIKQAIESEEKYHFLRELVSAIPDHQTEEDGSNSFGAVASGSGSSEATNSQGNPVKRPRGRPRKSRDGPGAGHKKERRKRVKKESSTSSASDDSEGTEDAEEDSDQEPNGRNNIMPAATAAAAASPVSAIPPPLASGVRLAQPGLPAGAFPGFPAPSMYPPGMPMYPGLPGGILPPSVNWPPSNLQLPGTSHSAAPPMMRAVGHSQEDDDYDT